MSTIEINMPQEMQEAANQIICEAGLTFDEIIQRLMQRIVQEHSVPSELLLATKHQEIGDSTVHENAIKKIQLLRKNRKKPAATIEEIIAWRDEARK